ncbi:MAG: DUF3164 family protein [Alphaproteobacteria bacterium]|nr:DUF3164 family protein [Alphaproteobacteria bacterium]
MSNAQHMINHEGIPVPIGMVKPQDKLRDDLVLSLFDKANELHKALAAFRIGSFEDVNAFVQLLAGEYKQVMRGKKGNMTFLSYDTLTKVQVQVADTIAFGPELQIAKSIIDECIKDSSEGVNDTILALVNHAFRVDKAGQVNRASILSLRQLDIKHEKWPEAMKAIADSMQTISTKQYIRFYRRADLAAPWQSLSLDFAAV